VRGILVIGLILVGMAAQAGQHVVTSLPWTFRSGDHSSDLWDTVTIAGTRLSSAADGLIFTPDYHLPLHHWYINLGKDTLEFGTAGGSNLEGIVINSIAGYPFHDIVVEGGWIIHKPPRNNDSTIKYNNCFEFGGSDLLVKNVNMRAAGWSGKCVTGNGYDIEIDGGTFLSDVSYYDSRCQFDALIMDLDGSFDSAFAAANGHSYNLRVHGVTIYKAPHAGIRMASSGTSRGVFQIYDCNLQGDARNLKYSSYSGTCASSSNPYMIALSRPGGGTDIHHNVIASGTTYGGCRGILVEHAAGNEADYVRIHDNNISIHEGPNVEYSENQMETHALRIRNGCHHVYVYNNTITATGDANIASPSYGRSVTPFRYSAGENDGVVNTFNIIEKNTFRAKSLTAGVTAYGVVFDAVMIYDTTLIFRYNRIESDNILVKYGEINDGAKGITLYGDTLKFLSPAYSPQTFHVGHLCNNFDCSRNFARDIVYEGGASDTNIIISCSAQGQMELGLQRTIRVKVVGNNGLPVAGASVQVSNNYRRTILAGFSGATGVVSGPATYWWQSRVSDSLLYNLFAIKAKKGADSASISYRVSAISSPVVITLTKTAGDSSLCDTCDVLCGDVNGDDLINVMDIGYLLTFLYKNGPPPFSFDAADVNNSGTITPADVTYLINALYKGGRPPICQ
jgi:hypothetical protein